MNHQRLGEQIKKELVNHGRIFVLLDCVKGMFMEVLVQLCVRGI
jgi:hypothetical protein